MTYPVAAPRLQWRTLVADDQGRFTRDTIYTAVAAFLALVGGLTLVICSILDGIARLGLDFDNGTLALMAGICVAPLTGGQVTTALQKAKDRRETQAVLQRRLPGRRGTDPGLIQPGDESDDGQEPPNGWADGRRPDEGIL